MMDKLKITYMMKTLVRLLTFGFVALALSAQTSRAQSQSTPSRCLGDVCFDEKEGFTGENLSLRGFGEFRYLIFNVYAAALYIEGDVSSPEAALEDVPKTLILHYHRSVTAKDIIDSSEKLLKSNPQVNLTQIRSLLDNFYNAYVDVKKGDRYVLAYIPGKGSTLYLNGTARITVPGADFAKAYFGIWLSRYGAKQSLAKKLVTKTD